MSSNERRSYLHLTGTIIGNVILVISGLVILMYICGFRYAVVLSGSMEPAIHTGSLCVYNKNYPSYNIEENDIIAFHRGTAVVTHRVVRITGDGFVTKGDANNSHDLGVVTPEDYIGKNVFSIPYLGYALRCICTTSGKIMAITILICIGLLLCILPPKKYRCKH